MSKNPFFNALAAVSYVIAIVLVIQTLQKVDVEQEGGIFVPIAMLLLLTLSAATMAYIFLLKPMQLYIDGERATAVSLFVKTLLVFAGMTFTFLLTLFLISV